MASPQSSDVQSFLELMAKSGVTIPPDKISAAETFMAEDLQSNLISQIKEKEKQLMSAWGIRQRLNDIGLQSWMIPNATVGKDYNAQLDITALKLEDIFIYEIIGLKEFGLSWDAPTRAITGTPTAPGMVMLKVKYAFLSDSASETKNYYSKEMHFVINPDPRTLWKNIASDREASFWKVDDEMDAAPLGSRNLVVCSKRGRSHQHKGTFRDDHYSYRSFDSDGWSVVAVSDGAGSAKYSREGSKVACEAIVDYFQNLLDNPSETILSNFDKVLTAYQEIPTGEALVDLENHAKQTLLYPAVLSAHERLKAKVQDFSVSGPGASKSEQQHTRLSDFHATLIFCLFKKYEFGSVLLTFGVGDCPIAVCSLGKDSSLQVKLLNILDVGEYGGGTRFVTQPGIFDADAEIPMAKRFSMTVMPSFEYLFLMTDGIYDPKFEVEANLEKAGSWVSFIRDLQGENEDGAAIEFNPQNASITQQLSAWMDFFSKGNHDDRTLAVVY